SRYCQELCFEECGSGGVSELNDSVGEDLSLDEGEDEFGGIEFAPVLGRGLGQLEHHDEAGLPGSITFGASVTQANGRERALSDLGAPLSGRF
ncbi:MAG: hypothetical protein ACKOFW_12335, partial [Planctomycetaceae bacterium]